MKILYLLSHPNTGKSFNHQIVDLGLKYLKKVGQDVKVVDMYVQKFDPLVVDPEHEQTQEYMELIGWSDLIVVQTPLYWWSVPAILKGLFDNVFPLMKDEILKSKNMSITTGGIYTRSAMDDYLGHVFQGVKDCGFELVSPFFATGINFAGEGKRKKHTDDFLEALARVIPDSEKGKPKKEEEEEEEGEGDDDEEEEEEKKEEEEVEKNVKL